MSVEFLPDDLPAGEVTEELPASRMSPRAPWLVLAVLVAAAGLVVWALARQGPGRHSAALPSRLAGSATPVACGGVLRCAHTGNVPAGLRTAVRRHLPDVVRVLAQTTLTERIGTGAYYLTVRRITIRTASSTVLIVLHRTVGSPVTGPSPIMDAPPGFGSLVVHKRLAGFEVDLQYVAPETVPPMLTALRELTADPGLESR